MKALAGQTAIYELSNLGADDQLPIGPPTNCSIDPSGIWDQRSFYSLIAFLIVICTFGWKQRTSVIRNRKDLKNQKCSERRTMILIALIGILTFISLDRGRC